VTRREDDLGASLRLFHLGAWRVRGIVVFFGFSRLFLFLASAVHISSYTVKIFKEISRNNTQTPPLLPVGPWTKDGRTTPFPFLFFDTVDTFYVAQNRTELLTVSFCMTVTGRHDPLASEFVVVCGKMYKDVALLAAHPPQCEQSFLNIEFFFLMDAIRVSCPSLRHRGEGEREQGKGKGGKWDRDRERTLQCEMGEGRAKRGRGRPRSPVGPVPPPRFELYEAWIRIPRARAGHVPYIRT
jgi:hypothetical protein